MDFGVPPPLLSIGISDVAENLEIIYGAQQLRGKILSRKELARVAQSLLAPPWL
jgi:hypothetical protein